MRPVYSNKFIIRNNEGNGETIIEFIHVYQTVENGKDVVKEESVSSIVLNQIDAIQLKQVIDKMIK